VVRSDRPNPASKLEHNHALPGYQQLFECSGVEQIFRKKFEHGSKIEKMRVRIFSLPDGKYSLRCTDIAELLYSERLIDFFSPIALILNGFPLCVRPTPTPGSSSSKLYTNRPQGEHREARSGRRGAEHQHLHAADTAKYPGRVKKRDARLVPRARTYRTQYCADYRKLS